MGRRIDIQADDICELLGEGGIIGELEVPPAVRAEAMGRQDRLESVSKVMRLGPICGRGA